MAPHRDDTDHPPPSPDEPASPDELAQARAFSELVDRLVADGELPRDLAEDERSLIDTAAIMRANLRAAPAPSLQLGGLIDGVIKDVRERAGVARDLADPARDLADPARDLADPARDLADPDRDLADPARDQGQDSGVIDLAARRREHTSRWRTVAPWSVAAIAAAAALVFALRTPRVEVRTEPPAPQVSQLSQVHRSRPADALVGQIPRTQADRARDRIDIIYADRMAGYRDLRLRGGTP